MHRLLTVSSYLYHEMTDEMTNHDIGCDFWRYLKNRLLDDVAKKIKVSDYVHSYVMKLDAKTFDEKYKCSLVNVKKSKVQLQFVVSNLTLMIKNTVSDSIISWI